MLITRVLNCLEPNVFIVCGSATEIKKVISQKVHGRRNLSTFHIKLNKCNVAPAHIIEIKRRNNVPFFKNKNPLKR